MILETLPDAASSTTTTASDVHDNIANSPGNGTVKRARNGNYIGRGAWNTVDIQVQKGVGMVDSLQFDVMSCRSVKCYI